MKNFTLVGLHKQGAPLLVAEPGIDWERDCNISVHLDSMKIHVRLGRPTQHRHLRRKLNDVMSGACYVNHAKPIDSSGGEVKGWMLTIQNPDGQSMAALSKILREEYGCSEEIELHRLDIALDVLPVHENTLVRRTKIMVALAATFVVPEILKGCAGWAEPRVMDFRYGGEGMDLWHALLSVRVRDTDTNQIIYIGADLSKVVNDRATGWKIYRKFFDKDRNGDRIPLKKPFVRFEVSLGSDELQRIGLYAVDDLADFNFRQLGAKHGYFRFWLPGVLADKWRGSERLACLLLSHGFASRFGYGASKGKKPGVAYGQLNDIVQARLKRVKW